MLPFRARCRRGREPPPQSPVSTGCACVLLQLMVVGRRWAPGRSQLASSAVVKGRRTTARCPNCYSGVAGPWTATYSRYMSERNPSSGPLVEGPPDPEHDPTASYALERAYVDRLTRRLVATSGADRRGALADQRPAPGPRPAVDRGRRRGGVPRGPARPRRSGRARSIDTRAAALLRLHDLVLDRQDEIIDLICWESGKARKHAFDEPLHIALTARYHARTAHQHLDSQRIRGVIPGLTRVDLHRHAKGVVGIISPWNYPFTMALCDGLPALLAGNAVVVKPDAQTMLSALLAAQLLDEAGLPAGYLAGRLRPGPPHRTRAGQARRLRLLHRLHRHRPDHRQGLRRPADRLLPRARRQEPDPGAA